MNLSITQQQLQQQQQQQQLQNHPQPIAPQPQQLTQQQVQQAATALIPQMNTNATRLIQRQPPPAYLNLSR